MSDFSKDFTSPEGREDGVSGVLVPDENGYVRAVFTEVTRDALKRAFAKVIDATYKDYVDIDSRREANLRAYEARSEPGQAITLPVVKRDVNQQFAWHCDAIFSKEPPFTVTALDNDPVQLVVDEGDGNGAQIVEMPGDEYAAQLQALINYYYLHRINFKKTLRAWIFSLLQDGNRPPILKVIYEEKERQVASLDIKKREDGSIERIEKDPVYRTVKDGESTRVEGVPGDKFYVPLPYDDIQRAPFVFQEFEEDVVTTKDKIARGVYDFCKATAPTQDDIDVVVSGCKSADDLERWRADGRNPAEPIQTNKFYELWFDYPFAEPVTAPNPETGENELTGEITTRMVPFCAVVHAQSKTWLNCYENNRWDRKRPFFAGRQQDRPYSFSGYSTAENVAPFQTLITQLFNAQLQNIAVSNVTTFGLREGSPTHRFFTKGGGKLRPGLIYPFGDPDDIKATPLGVPVGSMAGEIAFLNGEAEKMSVVTSADRGEVPNRTPVGTVAAVGEQAKLQPSMALDNIRDTIAEVSECFIRTLAQFNPGGVKVPFRDPRLADGVQVRVVGFPVEWRDGMFAFGITATGTEETSQALTLRDMNLGNEITKINGETMRMMGAAFTPGTPSPLQVLAMNMMRGRRNMFARVLQQNKLNPDDYLPSQRQIEQLPIELQELQQLAAQNQPPQGGPNEQVPSAESGGAVPPGAGGGPPVPQLAGQPGDGGPGGMAPPQAL